MPGTFSLPPQVRDPDMHHGTCVMHMPWCMPGSLNSSFLRTWWQGRHFRHSWHMRHPQLYVSGKRPMSMGLNYNKASWCHEMETFSASDMELWCFFDLRLNKRLSKHSWGWWFETLSCPLWRHCNDQSQLLATVEHTSDPRKGHDGLWLWVQHTVRCHYNTVNFYKRHPIARPLGRGMGCLLWIQHLVNILP